MAEPTVGVCWTRNMVTFALDKPGFGLVPHEWGELHTSVATLLLSGEVGVGSCVFTEAPRHVVDRAMRLWTAKRPGLQAAHSAPHYGVEGVPSGSLFDFVLPTSDARSLLAGAAEAIGEGGQVSAMLTKLESANFRNKSSLATKLLSRTGRLANLAAAPFNVTLFLDDDTFFCPPPLPYTATRAAAFEAARLRSRHAAGIEPASGRGGKVQPRCTKRCQRAHQAEFERRMTRLDSEPVRGKASPSCSALRRAARARGAVGAARRAAAVEASGGQGVQCHRRGVEPGGAGALPRDRTSLRRQPAILPRLGLGCRRLRRLLGRVRGQSVSVCDTHLLAWRTGHTHTHTRCTRLAREPTRGTLPPAVARGAQN
ncbi:hypothetical protein EMIHUDRAFT_433195 [Emiliania huxleyi CCMP1516]|uniref:Nucleotide-diphospho-sugar transferase domain-containing protein n=2 Tax=Emiliania huxleyi TaxID=2903 RepID=A0A0D3I2E2_EMIH1|nr:hypothetical protein EMIHUDRAFT_433195 [Emiliania huxleyi CCMP1516]EOD05427.1 hypothetical protein EMIHUDRAFT_433195 [Emiliania huxleyi CCMP1516]|eukprot:XP_005757856.1 hypothetical protein EMIHUDRAFT_433195 [Emiliania huxleyi CCMP1516]